MYGEIMREHREAVSPEADKLGGIWRKVTEAAERELGRDPVQKWLRQVTLSEIRRDLVVLTAPSSFVADWVERNYGLHLLRYLQAQLRDVRRLTVEVEERLSVETGAGDLHFAPELPPTHALQSAPLDPRFTFDSFVVGKPNELAHAAARRVADTADGSFNPVFLHGGVGLGKTHLMHAIGWQLQRTRPDCRVLYLSAVHASCRR